MLAAWRGKTVSSSRKDRIRRVADSRAQAKPARWLTFWVTRDRVCGQLAEIVRVWLREPRMVRCDDGDVFWYAALENGESAIYADWTLDVCRHELHTLPDDERQVLRKNGNAGVMPPGEVAS